MRLMLPERLASRGLPHVCTYAARTGNEAVSGGTPAKILVAHAFLEKRIGDET